MTAFSTVEEAQVHAPAQLSRAQVLLFAFACGATTANVYYAQSIAGPIAASLNLSAGLAGLIVTTTQVGYGIGLFFLVCLSDLMENRRLVLMTTAGTIASLIGVACSTSAPALMIASLALGISAVGSQILVPLAVNLSPERLRGQVIGSIMGGLVTGIMLSRPLSSFLTAHWGWRAVFVVSAVIMSGLLLLLSRSLPRYQPRPKHAYGATLRSMLRLLATSRPLQRRAAYQGTMFCIFNLFWTTVPLMLQGRFGFSQVGIAVFALAGAAGAFSAPFAGRMADRGKGRIGTGIALASAGVALLISGWGGAATSVLLMVVAAIVLDAATQANQVFGQRIIQSIDPAARGRLNAVYMTVLFLCGAVGSALGSVLYFHFGWWATVAVGTVMAVGMLGVFATEGRTAATR